MHALCTFVAPDGVQRNGVCIAARSNLPGDPGTYPPCGSGRALLQIFHKVRIGEGGAMKFIFKDGINNETLGKLQFSYENDVLSFGIDHAGLFLLIVGE